MNYNLLIKGISAIIPGHISNLDFSILSKIDRTSSKELLDIFVQNGIGELDDNSVNFHSSDKIRGAIFALENGAHLTKKLVTLKNKYNFIIEIRGMGLLIGMEMNKDVSSEIVKICLEKGLLLNAVRPNMLRFMPPLNVSQKEIDVAIKILDESLSKTVN